VSPTGYSASNPDLPWSVTSPLYVPGTPGGVTHDNGEMLGLVATMTGAGSIKCSVIAVAENAAAQQLYTTTATDCTTSPDKQAVDQLWEYSDYGWEGGANC
jgi:hypothetical protein